MYDFLYSEVWWVEVACGTIIGIFIACIFIAFMTYGDKLNDVFKYLSDLAREHKDLTKEHDSLSNEHKLLLEKNHEILNGQVEISGFTSDTKSIVSKIHEEALLEKGRQEALFSALSASGKELNKFIATGINSIKALQQDYIKMSELSNNQYLDISQLKEKINHLQEWIDELQEDNNQLDKENEQLVRDYNILAEKYDELSRELEDEQKQ